MFRKRFLFLALVFVLPPGAARAACYISDVGTLYCQTSTTLPLGAQQSIGSAADTSGNLFNDLTQAVSAAPFTDIDLSAIGGISPSTPVNIYNAGRLVLAPGAGAGSIYVGGYIWNGWGDNGSIGTTGGVNTGNNLVDVVYDGSGGITSSTDTNGTAAAALSLSGGYIEIDGRDAKGVALLNQSTAALPGIPGTSMSINAATSLFINGSVWNNTTNGTGATAITSATGMSLTSAGYLEIIGDFVNFGGNIALLAGDSWHLLVQGAMNLAGPGTANISGGTISIGNGLTLGAGAGITTMGTTTIGANTIVTNTITITGDLTNNAASFSATSAGVTQVTGNLTQTAGTMNLNAGQVVVGGLWSQTGGISNIDAPATLDVGGIDIGAGAVMNIKSGLNMALGAQGLTLADGLAFGTSAVGASMSIAGTKYTISSTGDISAGGLLGIKDGNDLTIGGAYGGNIAVGFAGGIANGVGSTLLVDGSVLSFESGNITNSGSITIGNATTPIASTIKTGAITNTTTGTMALTAGGQITTEEIMNSDADMALNGANIVAGDTVLLTRYDIQNNGTGLLTLTSNGTVWAGKLVNVAGGTFKILGNGSTIVNVSDITNNGTMYLGWDGSNVLSLAKLTAADVVNNGSFRAEVIGATTLDSLANNGNATDLWLKTGTLAINDGGTSLDNLLNNDLNLMHLELTGDSLAAGTITNSTAGKKIEVIATALTTTGDVANGGIMNLTASAGNVDIGGALSNISTATLWAFGQISVANTTTNTGTLTLRGQGGVSLDNLENSGTANVYTSTGAGVFAMGGKLENLLGATLTVDVFKLNLLDDFINNGTADFTFRNAGLTGLYNIGSIKAESGVLNLNGAGTLTLNSGFSVESAASVNINSGAGIKILGGDFSVAGAITYGQTPAVAGSGGLNLKGQYLVDVVGAISAGSIMLGGALGETQLLALKTTGDITVAGAIATTNASSVLTLSADNISANSITQIGGASIVADSDLMTITGAAAFSGGIDFDGGSGYNGLVIMTGTPQTASGKFELIAASLNLGATGGIALGGGTTPAPGSLTLDITSAGQVFMGGASAVAGNGILNIGGAGVTMFSLANAGATTITSTSGALTFTGDIVSSGDLTLQNTGQMISANALKVTGGEVLLDADEMNFTSLTQTAGGGKITFTGSRLGCNANSTASACLLIPLINRTGPVVLAGDLAFGGAGANLFALNLTNDDGALWAQNLTTAGDVVNYGATGAVINLTGVLSAANLSANAGALDIKTNTMNLSGNVGVLSGATLNAVARGGIAVAGGMGNAGILSLTAQAGMTAGAVSNSGTMTITTGGGQGNVVLGALSNTGTLTITAWNGFNNTGQTAWTGDHVDEKYLALSVAGITNTGAGRLNLNGYGLKSSGDIVLDSLWQSHAASVNNTNGSVWIASTDYTMSVAGGQKIEIAGGMLGHTGDKLSLETNYLTVGGDINANGGTLVFRSANTDAYHNCKFGYTGCAAANMPGIASPFGGDNWAPWMSVDVVGNVSGRAQFYGVGSMHIGGNYTFDKHSVLQLAVLPDPALKYYYSDGSGKLFWRDDTCDGAATCTPVGHYDTANPTDANGYTFFANIVRDPVTNRISLDLTDAQAIVQVDGRLITDLGSADRAAGGDIPLYNPANKDNPGNMGLTIFDGIMSETAVWLVHADSIDNMGFLARNMNVYFCNADGTKCFDYLNAAGMTQNAGGAVGGMPALIREDDTDGDGVKDSLFAVFDPRYGGPILIRNNWLQPAIKPLDPDKNVYAGAGAIDNWIRYGLIRNKFNPDGNTPIEALKSSYKGTIFEEMARELYDRMESYSLVTQDPRPFENFARLFLPVEAAQLARQIGASERMVQSGMQKRLIDESLWTRARVAQKAWIDFDYGMISVAPESGEKASDGMRMYVSAGYDTQIGPNTIIGFSAGMSSSETTNNLDVDLGYDMVAMSGARRNSARDASVNIGAYALYKMSDTTSMYASANVQSHTLSLSREQNFVGAISGDGKASSITGEAGLIHTLSAQYVVGSLYARFGRSQGFTLSETIDGQGYMDLQQNGYTTVAPGYSLMVQKRMYLQPTFIMRPYLSVGAEYELSGMPGTVQYKFATSDVFSEYMLNADPLWATGKAGLEFLSISGLQFGLGYEYHYNANVQAHGAHVGASMRF